jgi:hypothetical protein
MKSGYGLALASASRRRLRALQRVAHRSQELARRLPVGGALLWSGQYDVRVGEQFRTVNLIRPAGGGIPEPLTWAMMVAGFGLVGAAVRRRQTATV